MTPNASRPLPPELVAFVAHARKAGASRFVLRQVMAGVGDSHVTAYESAAYPQDRELAEDVWTRARADASAFAGVTTYFLCAHRKDEEVYFDRHPLRVAATPISDLRPSEEPNALGLIAQAMRHNEAMALLYTDAASEANENLRATCGELRKTVVEQQKTITELSRQQLEVLTLREKMVSEDHVRQLETRRSEAEEKRQQWAIEQLGAVFLPMIQQGLVAKMMGPGAAAAKGEKTKGKAEAPADPLVAIEGVVWESIAKLIASLRGDAASLARVWEALSEEQRGLMGAIFKAAGDRASVIAEREAHAQTNGVAGAAKPAGGSAS